MAYLEVTAISALSLLNRIEESETAKASIFAQTYTDDATLANVTEYENLLLI